MSQRITGLGAIVVIAIVASFGSARAAVVFTETFDDLANWTVLDADGAGTAAVVEVSGGRLHVVDNDPVVDVDDHGLMAGQVAPLGGARLYTWGINNTTAGFVGNINLSSSTGLKHETATPMGEYFRWNFEPQILRRVNNDNIEPAVTYLEDTDYDLRLDYDGSLVSHYYKLSSSITWIQIGDATAYTPAAGDYFLNITSLGKVFTGNAVDSDWYIDQIDITDTSHPVLTLPVPEPAGLSAVMIAAALGVAGRRRR